MDSNRLNQITFFSGAFLSLAMYLHQSIKKLSHLVTHYLSLSSQDPPIHAGWLKQPFPLQVLQTQDIINQLDTIVLSSPMTTQNHAPALFQVGELKVFRNPNMLVDERLYTKTQKRHFYASDSFNYIYPIAYLCKPLFSGIKIGHAETLLTLEDQHVVLIGTAVQGIVERPLAIVKELKMFKSWLRAQIMYKSGIVVFQLALLAYTLYIAFKKYSKEAQNVKQEPGGIEAVVTQKENSFLCGICKKELRCRVLMPCEHLSVCA